jgi:transposase
VFIGKLQFNLGPGLIYGLDISKNSVSVTEIHPNQDVHQYEFPLNDEGLNQFLSKLKPDDRVAMEVSSNSRFLYDRIKPLVKELKLADPRKLSVISKSQAKNDRNDSYLLAMLLAVGVLPEVWVPDPQTQADRDLLHRRQSAKGNQTRTQNRIHSLLAQHGLRIEASDLNTKDARLFLAQVTAKLPEGTRQALVSLLRELDFQVDEVRKLDAQAVVRAQRWQPTLALLMTIPGVGILLAFTILAVIGTVDRFPEPASLGNYTGDVPSLYQSGSKSHSGSITKAGPGLLRWALTEAVYGLIRSDGYFRNMYRRIRGKNKDRHGLAVTACARELAEVIWRMLKTQRTFAECVPQPRPESAQQAERHQNRQQRKERRQTQTLVAARQEVSQQPPALEVIQGHIATLKELTRVPDNRTPLPPELATNSKHTLVSMKQDTTAA